MDEKKGLSRRFFLKGTGAGVALFAVTRSGVGRLGTSARAAELLAPVAGGTLDPVSIPKYVEPLVIPPAMPRTTRLGMPRTTSYYEIAVRQFQQQILPPKDTSGSPLPTTKVWSYGSVNHPGSFNYPAFTIEAKWKQPVRVKWINDLVDGSGNYLPHILPVDPTLHWANPPGGQDGRDTRPDDFGATPGPYTGPVPIITHVHGAHTTQESDGYPEAWYLPAAANIPNGYATEGSFYDTFKGSSPLGGDWATGSAVFEYANEQRATTLWYHDHTLGMTRLNVYAGPAGFYLLRGGPDDGVLDSKNGKPATLPGPAPALGDPAGMSYYEIPIVIQDRSFNADGSLFFPDNRAFFEGLNPSELQIPFIPEPTCGGEKSDISPIWNPEFFGNTWVVNGKTWPYLEVEQRRYRFRFLNGCNSRFAILKMDNGLPFWQIGSDGGFLPKPVELDQILLALAERADVIVDFSDVPVGTAITLQNIGPDEPFGGGLPDEDFDAADPDTTGQVMQFRVVKRKGNDPSTPVDRLVLPAIASLGAAVNTRKLSLNEEMSETVKVVEEEGAIVEACDDEAEAFGPREALLGTLGPDGMPVPKMWAEAVTENPAVNTTEIWEIYNVTADAHPIHVHLVQFQVVDRQGLALRRQEEEEEVALPIRLDGSPRPPESWETGFKDTVIAYPGEVTRIRARFDLKGLFVWHCHIIDHEDNEMMRPYKVI